MRASVSANYKAISDIGDDKGRECQLLEVQQCYLSKDI